MVNGVLNIDKPENITSHDVVNRIRKVSGQKRVGHAGTLDPFATGVLVVGLGSATRLLDYVHDLSKTYVATFMLGAISDTDDRTGTIQPQTDTVPTKQAVTEALQSFVGTIQQIPPAYSAVKVQGKKMYELARSGVAAIVQPREVIIHNIQVRGYEYPKLDVEITCAAGTYIRAIARDLGQKIGIGAYVDTLRRTTIGDFSVEGAASLDNITADTITQYLLPPALLIPHLPQVILNEVEAKDFKHGKRVPMNDPSSVGPIAVFTKEKTLLGIGSYISTEQMLQPDKVI
ncbi:MAG: tRNA pseudouridine(55) synthase TruB [Candidatus Andersenbacteria bacterium]|nr:tRNA pseudouridine(55) synthase TruB [Candidatus Andersenbacteria bacterium]MBI3251136.1 tRNA pseudouridine(55) synthase TruB [Candidatus Andersenbacteria bacterium]